MTGESASRRHHEARGQNRASGRKIWVRVCARSRYRCSMCPCAPSGRPPERRAAWQKSSLSARVWAKKRPSGAKCCDEAGAQGFARTGRERTGSGPSAPAFSLSTRGAGDSELRPHPNPQRPSRRHIHTLDDPRSTHRAALPGELRSTSTLMDAKMKHVRRTSAHNPHEALHHAHSRHVKLPEDALHDNGLGTASAFKLWRSCQVWPWSNEAL